MQSDSLVDRLVAGLTPVGRPRVWRDIALLVLLAVVELGIYIGIGHMRPDIDAAMAQPIWWWKLASAAVVATLATVIAVRSFAPGQNAPFARKSLGPLILLVIIAGWGINAMMDMMGPLMERLHWQAGLYCVSGVLSLSVVPMLAFGLMMRRGASTDPALSANAAGLAAAGWGTAVFVFHCPHDDVLYVEVWYTVSMLLVIGAARLILPRLTRW